MIFCTDCGSQMSKVAAACPSCGHPNREVDGKKSKVAFVLLACFLGGLGIHRFYLGGGGNIILGIIYLLFCWTYVPAIIALFEALVIGLRKNDPRFSVRV